MFSISIGRALAKDSISGYFSLIVLEINIVDGDAKFSIHEDLLPDSTSLADLHNTQVEQSKETIARTLEALADLGEKIGDKLEAYMAANPSGPSN